MSRHERKRPAGGGQRGGKNEPYGNGAPQQDITAAEIAHALEARQAGPGRWMARCVAHEDRTPSLSITEGGRGPLLYCFAGCSQDEVIGALRERGLWRKPTVRVLQARQRREEADELWREALRRLTHGEPLRYPPYTRTLPRSGEVWIVCGPNAWPAAKSLHEHGRHALVWPYAERGYIPCTAYCWPVVGRRIRVFDTTDDIAPNGPWAETVRDFGRLLVARWGAARVECYGDFEPVLYQPEGVRYAA